MKQVTAVVIGAGQRGADVYAAYALNFPNELKIVGVAEPLDDRRAEFAKLHGISDENCFNTWEELLGKERFADCALVCTQDKMHYGPVMRALELGYDVLCEKPMSPDRDELLAMGQKAADTGRILSIAHVLRYSPFFVKIKELIDEGAIGDLMTIQHIESVGYWHMAHSFVRGNWRSSKETSPMILAKCCHDMDILLWLAGSRCKSVSSFGSLKHFKAENAPKGAAKYCLENDKPYLGLCLGLQTAVIAAARRGGVKKANSEEFDAPANANVVYIMEGQKGKESTGGTMRLGNYPAKLVNGSLAEQLYGTSDVVERHRHRYEVNQKFLKEIEKGGLKVSGTSPDGKLVEYVEAPDCKYFIATQAHPEFRSRPYRAHPLFEGLIRASIK